MATVTVNDASLSAIADAIREKLDVETTYLPSQMAAAIESISGTDLTSADEGKVVVEDAGSYVLAAQTSRSVSQNGTYDTTTNNEVVVNVSGGGGGSANILSGTGQPDASVGENGSIYMQYSELPTGYKGLEYIAVGSSGPYINTGVPASSDAYFEIDFKSDGNAGGFFFGANDYSSSISQVGIYGNKWYVAYGGGSAWNSITTDRERHVIRVDSTGMYFDGENVGSAGTSFNTAYNYYIFWRQQPSGSDNKASNIMVYRCKIYSGSTIVRDMMPAIRESDSTIGMYDLVNDVFYGNSSSGSFIAGQQYEQGDIIAVYLKVNGSWLPIEGQDIDDVNLGS